MAWFLEDDKPEVPLGSSDKYFFAGDGRVCLLVIDESGKGEEHILCENCEENIAQHLVKILTERGTRWIVSDKEYQTMETKDLLSVALKAAGAEGWS